MKELLRLIGEKLYSIIFQSFKENQVEEIRLRANCPLVVCSNGKNFVVPYGQEKYYVVTDEDINKTIAVATENSMYAVEEQIKQMYISYYGGIRIGITGEIVEKDGKVVTIKYVNSLNIRIPHEIKDFSKIAMNFIVSGGIKNTLVVSPPGAGKTTLIRDIARNLSLINIVQNVLLVDERKELAFCHHGRPTLDVGIFTDIISGGNKTFAFEYAVRSLKPNVIITDELSGQKDFESSKRLVESGVKIIASVHAANQVELTKVPYIKTMLEEKIFERIIVLSEKSPNRYVGIYDGNLRCLYMPY